MKAEKWLERELEGRETSAYLWLWSIALLSSSDAVERSAAMLDCLECALRTETWVGWPMEMVEAVVMVGVEASEFLRESSALVRVGRLQLVGEVDLGRLGRLGRLGSSAEEVQRVE